MTKIEEFVNRFHSINDVKIKDKRKHFNEFLLLLQSNIHNEEDLDIFVKSLTPKTPLEEMFKIDLMLRLARKDILLQELKTCNRILTKKLLGDWKLFSEIFSKITADELVNNMFIHLSFSLKLKILNGICKNVNDEALLNQHFIALEKKYGLKIAAIILPGCSIDLIRSNIEKYHFKLTNVHLKHIFKKDKQFPAFYFNIIKKKYENMDLSDDYRSTLKYIAKVEPNIYWKLCDEFDLNVKFGKHMTPGMIKSNEKIIEKGKSTFNMFHLLKMYKTMKKEQTLNALLLNFYPNTPDGFPSVLDEYQFMKFIKNAPHRVRYNLLSTIFCEKYQKNLLDYPKYFTEELLKITPIKEREEILDVKIQTEKNLLYLYSPAAAIPQLKQRLQNSSDISTRKEVARYLYETCAVNKNQNALLEVLKYALEEHRNDKELLRTFYSHAQQWPNKDKLSKEHWKCLLNIMKLKDKDEMYFTYTPSFYGPYLNHLIKNNKSYDKIIEYFTNKIAEKPNRHFYPLQDEKYEQIYFDKITKYIEKYKDTEKYEKLVFAFFYLILRNFHNKKIIFLLSKYQHMFDQLKPNEWISELVTSICLSLDNPIIHELFWKSENKKDNSILLWYAINRPDLLKENIDKMLIRYDEFKLDRFFKKLCTLVDAETVNKIKTITLKHIEDDEYDKATYPIRTISVLAPKTFLEIVRSFLPDDSKINLEEATDRVNLQQILAKSLANIENPLKSFPLILKFCIGDYLKFGLSALYTVIYNAPEKYIKDFLTAFSNTAVSVRKHVLSIGRHLLTADDFHQLLQDWNAKEKNLSMRNILLKKVIEYFIENPTENFWNLIENNINTIDVNDRDYYDFLIKFQKIPLDYLPKYLEMIYRELNKNSDVEINKKKYELIEEIPNNVIDRLNEGFIIELIKETVCIETYKKFHWKCVFHTTGPKQLKFFEKNFEILKAFVDQSGSELTRNVETRTEIANFLVKFFHLSIELKQSSNLIENFMTSWTSIFNPEQFNREYMLIQFTNLYFLAEFNTYEMGLKVNGLLYDYIDKYNNTIVQAFCQQLNTFLSAARIDGHDLFKFANGLFQNKKDENAYVAVIHFLPKVYPNANNIYADYVPIVESIESCDFPLVQYHFDTYLTINDLKSSFDHNRTVIHRNPQMVFLSN